MAIENFKVKKGLEVGTGITANSDGVDVTGIITATQFKGDGSGLTGVVGSGSGVIIKDEGSAVGTAGTINFVGSGVAASLNAGTATVTINAGTIAGIDTTGTSVFNKIDVDGQTELDDVNIAGVVTATKFAITSGGQVNIGGNLSQANYPVQITTVHANEKISFYRAQHDDLSDEGAGIAFARKDTGFELASGLFSHSNGGLGVAARESIVFLTGGGTGIQQTDEALRITSAGKVGIGTANPARNFHVVGTSRFEQLDVVGFSTFGGSGTKFFHHVPRIEMQGSNTAQFQLTNATAGTTLQDGMVMGFSSSSQVGFINICESGHGFILKTGGTATSAERINISGVGTVSIRKGTTEEMITARPDGAVELYFNANKKLETTVSGITVPHINVSGIGTFGTRIDTNGVTLGTNATTFAAKFADNARAIFGGATNGDFGIYHDTNHSYLHRIPGGQGDIYMMLGGDNAIIAKTDGSVELYWDDAKKLATDQAGVIITGVATATSFSGSGAGLTNIPSAQLSGALPALDGSALTGVTASGSGVIIKHDGSTVGTAGTINFSTNLDVTAVSAGIVTVTASGGSATTINNNANNRLITGSGTANTLEAESGLTYDGTYFNHIGSGFKQLKIDTSTSNSASLLLKNQQGNFTINTINNSGNRNFTIYDGTAGVTRFSINHNGTVGITSGLNVTGVATATTFSGSGASLTNLPAANLTGTIAAISGANLTSLNADNLGSGEIPSGRFPATLPAVSGANLTNLPVPTQITVADESSDTSCNVLFSTAATGDLAPKSGTNLTFNSANGTLTATTFSGSGASLTNLPAANLTGTLPAISGANLTNLPADTPTNSDIQVVYAVTANGSSAYRFAGNGVVSTADNPDLYLIRGQKYRFINNSGGSHPFQIRVSSGGSAYSTGVTNNGASSGNIDFAPTYDSPAQLVYQCTSHGGMVGNIYIRGASGGEINVGVSTFTGDITIKSSTPLLRLTDTDTSGPLNVDIESVSGDLYLDTGSVHRDVIVSSAGRANEIIRFTGDGKVGVNTTTGDGLINTRHAGTNQQVLHVKADLGSSNGRSLNLFTPDTDNANAPFRFQTGNGYLFQCDGEDVFTIAHDRTVGINTQTTQDSAHFQHYQTSARHQSFQSTNGDLAIVTDNNSNPAVYIKGTGTADLVNVFDNTSEVFTILDGGNIGINDASPSYPLNVIGDNAASNGIGMLKGIIGVQNDTTAFGSSPTAGISFQTKYRTGPDVPLDVAAIWGGKENTTNGDKDGYMGFATREEGGSGTQERMRITSDGQLLIGRTSSSAYGNLLETKSMTVEVDGDTTGMRFNRTDTNAAWVAMRFYIQGSQKGYIQINTNSITYNAGSSDIRVKKDIEDWTEEVLPYFKSLKPQKFRFNSEDETAEKTKGYMAQDNFDKFPEAYPLNSEDDRYWFAPQHMVPYLMKALQEEIVKREEIEAKYNALEARISALEGS